MEQNFRERERLKCLITRWVAKFESRLPHEQKALYAALSIVWWEAKGSVMCSHHRAMPTEGIIVEQRKITLRHELITPESARSILTNERYERQRPLDQSVVQEYALAMLNDEFRQGTVISFAVYKGKRYLINGQHTLEAICRAGIALELGIEEIPVDTMEERSYWFSKYDRLKLRSLKQIYDANVIHEAVNMNKSQADCLGACLPLLASGFSSAPRMHGSMRMYTSNPRLRMDFIKAWADEASQFYAAIKGAPGSLSMNIRRAPVFAVALVTYRFTGNDAGEFWADVAQADGLNQGDQRLALHVFLRTTKLKTYEPHVYSRYIASAWCKAWNNQRGKEIKPQAEHLPIFLEGTPHDGQDIFRYINPRGEVLHDPVKYDAQQWQIGLFGGSGAAD